jgi:hypothetical protein
MPHLLCARLANTIIANLHHFDASQASSVVSFIASTVIISGGTALHMASSAIRSTARLQLDPYEERSLIVVSLREKGVIHQPT